MMRLITPIILLVISVAAFFLLIDPIYKEVDVLRAQADSYDDALSNAKELENERDKLTTQQNAIPLADLEKLQKLLPENLDNIRLILEIEKIALPYGMALKNVKYDTVSNIKKDSEKNSTEIVSGGMATEPTLVNQDYGSWDLSFSTTGTYGNFLSFTRDLEKNLRIVDIVSIDFSSSGTTPESGAKINNDKNAADDDAPISPLAESYEYSFKIKTYWLKN